MSCAVRVNNNNYGWEQCGNGEDFIVETMINDTVLYTPCCHYHLTGSIRSLMLNTNTYQYYNRVVNTQICVIDKYNNKKEIHFGNVTFGPETESDYNKKNYEDFCLEMDRIGSIYLPDNMYQQLYQEDEPDLMCYE